MVVSGDRAGEILHWPLLSWTTPFVGPGPTQHERLLTLTELPNLIPATPEDVTVGELDGWVAHIEELHQSFVEEHVSLEQAWLAAYAGHQYFEQDTHGQEQSIVMLTRSRLSRLRSQLMARQVPTGNNSTGSAQDFSKLPSWQLPSFSGDYKEWPEFIQMFRTLVLDKQQVPDVQKLYYLRSCLIEARSHLISNLPLTAESLQPSLDLLTQKYENKRLIIQSYLDKMFSIAPVTSESSKVLGALIGTVAEAQQALVTLEVSETLGDHILVHHVKCPRFRDMSPDNRKDLEKAEGTRYYLPHHGVLRPEGATTKLRVVFNGSSPTTSGLSVNDILHTGANLLLNVMHVLIWLRQHRHLFATDITKMFRQIKVHAEDRDL